MEIIPGIHQVEGISGANVYLLAEETLTLVDAGLPGNGARVLSYIKGIGRQPEELKEVILTHNHIDHIGSAAELQALTRAEVLAHPDDTVVINGSAIMRPTFRRGRLARKFAPRPSTKVTQFVRDNDIRPCFGGLRIVHTPGHTPGSICPFLVAKRVLFSGDTIINNGNRLSRPLPYPGADVEQIEASLRKIAELDIEACLFSHGEPLLTETSAKVRQFVVSPPTSPVAWRMMKNLRRLASFHFQLMRRH